MISSIADTLREAVSYLLKAESDYKQLSMFRQLMDVQYLLSVVYHNLGLESERNEAINRHSRTQTESKELEVMVVDDSAREIWEVVSEVGVALSQR
jgi:anaphase-promoting complex subunit 5